jgi:hypothetical protein
VAAPRDKAAILVFALLGLGLVFALAGDGGGGLGGASYDVDLREKAAPVRYKEGDGYGKASGQVKRTYKTRSMDKIKGITVHHVGVPEVGESGIHKFTYHAVVHHDGTVYWLHPFTTYLLHGHGLNRDTIAIAVSGSFGNVTKELPPAQAAGLRRAIAWATAQANADGADVSEIWTHRQASSGHGYDPGRSPYREGVMWAQSSLGLEHDPNATRGTGLEIPDKWLAEAVELEQDPILMALLEDVGRVSPRSGTEAFAWAEGEGDHIAGEPYELGLV